MLEFVLYAEYIAYNSGGMTYEFRDRADYLPTVMEKDDILGQILHKALAHILLKYLAEIVRADIDRLGHLVQRNIFAVVILNRIAQMHGDYLMNIRLKVLEFVLYAEYIAYNSGGMTSSPPPAAQWR